jgi:ankyrin repeat protein
MIAFNRKWLLETPLAAAWRSRLELGFGIVLSAASVIVLSEAIRPAPEKLAALHGGQVVASSFQVDAPDALPRTLSSEMAAAAQAGDVVAMRSAWRHGMPLDRTLAMAARTGHKDAVVWLLAHGANVHDEEWDVTSPMLVADAYPEIVTLLRERGAVEPTLENAAGANAPNALRRVLALHPSQVRDGGVLRAAAGTTAGTPMNKELVVRMLLDAGADPNGPSYNEWSALGLAVQSCGTASEDDAAPTDCMNVVRLLLDRGARVTGDALGAALSLDDDTRTAPLDALLEHPIAKGVTASALASATKVQKQDLDRIVKLGVDWAWHDGENDEALPLLAAVRRGDRDVTRALIDAGAPVDVHFKSATCALAEAIDQTTDGDEPPRIVELLVTRGADVNRRFPDGRTPLFAAAEAGNIRVINFLLARGARVNDRVLDDGALDAAEEHGNTPAARVLAAHGARRLRMSSPSY